MKTINLLNGLPLPPSSHRATFFPVIGATARVRRRDFPALGEVISLWFAMLSPLIGLVIGFLGAWFVAWLTS
jgi:phosphate/sulfate permease